MLNTEPCNVSFDRISGRSALPCPQIALFRLREMSDLSPQGAPKQTRTISTAISVALATFSPAYPLSAKTRSMKGNNRRERLSSAQPPSRSWYAGRMRFEHEATPVRIDERVAFAPIDLLASIVTACPAGLGGLDALAVNDRGRRAGVAPDPFAAATGSPLA